MPQAVYLGANGSCLVSATHGWLEGCVAVSPEGDRCERCGHFMSGGVSLAANGSCIKCTDPLCAECDPEDPTDCKRCGADSQRCVLRAGSCGVACARDCCCPCGTPPPQVPGADLPFVLQVLAVVSRGAACSTTFGLQAACMQAGDLPTAWPCPVQHPRDERPQQHRISELGGRLPGVVSLVWRLSGVARHAVPPSLDLNPAHHTRSTMPGCLRCASDGRCAEDGCKRPTTFRTNGTCVRCDEAHPGCLACTDDGRQCIGCQDGLALQDDGACKEVRAAAGGHAPAPASFPACLANAAPPPPLPADGAGVHAAAGRWLLLQMQPILQAGKWGMRAGACSLVLQAPHKCMRVHTCRKLPQADPAPPPPLQCRNEFCLSCNHESCPVGACSTDGQALCTDCSPWEGQTFANCTCQFDKCA